MAGSCSSNSRSNSATSSGCSSSVLRAKFPAEARGPQPARPSRATASARPVSRSRMNGRTSGSPPTNTIPRTCSGHTSFAWRARIVPIEWPMSTTGSPTRRATSSPRSETQRAGSSSRRSSADLLRPVPGRSMETTRKADCSRRANPEKNHAPPPSPGRASRGGPVPASST